MLLYPTHLSADKGSEKDDSSTTERLTMVGYVVLPIYSLCNRRREMKVERKTAEAA